MRLLRKFTERYYFRRVIIYISMCCLIFNVAPLVALAGPEGAEVVHGQVSFQQSGLNTTIHASDKSIINYRSFDIARPEVVQFMQPSSSASVLNRILSANPTSIDGTLLANGRVFFVNPAGVIIGGGARINVNQLVASGLNISNDSFINGQYEFVGGGGTVANYGDISAQSVYLVGKQVTNVGNINCPDGYVVMAAGDRVFLGQPGSSVIVEIGSLEPPDQADAQPSAEITNQGTAKAAGGTIILAAAGDVFSRPIMANTGSLSTSNAKTDAGNISLQGGEGKIDNAGAITATSDSGAGGTVTASASEVINAGTVDVSGTQGGTVAFEGTDYLGQFGTVSADGSSGNGGDIDLWAGEVIVLGTDSLTTANAGTNGDGGEVIMYSPKTALFESDARVETKGGSQSGNGGFFELSGKEYVETFGQIDLTASNGESGMFLIDPLNLTIVDSVPEPEDGGFTGPNGEWQPGSTSSQLDIDILEGYLSLADLTLSTLGTDGSEDGDIIFDADRYLESGDPTGYSLTIEAARNIEFTTSDGINFVGDGDVKLYAGGHIISADRGTDTISTLRGDIIMEAGSDGSGVGIDVGHLTVGASGLDYPGEIRLSTTDGGNITTESLSVKGNGYGSIYVFSSGDLTINGSSPVVSIKTNYVPAGEDASSFVCLTAEEDVTISGGDIRVEAHGNTQSVASIWIGAGTNVQDPENGYPGTVSIDGVVQADASAAGALIEDATVKIYGKNIILPSQHSKTPIATTGSVWYQGTTTDYDASDNAVYEWDPDNPDSDPDNRNPLYDKLVSGSRALVVIDRTKDGTCLNCGNVILPIALPDWLNESKNIMVYAIVVLANDEDGEGGALIGGTVFLDGVTQSAAGGTLTLINGDTEVQYEPPADWVFDDNGEFTDFFDYYAVDADGDISAGSARVMIILKNQNPVANNNSYAQSHNVELIVNEADGTIKGTLNSALEDYDPDNNIPGAVLVDTLTAELVSPTTYGTVVLDADGSFTYTPVESLMLANTTLADDTFTYTLSDGFGGTDTATVTIDLSNLPPVAKDDAYGTSHNVTLDISGLADGVIEGILPGMEDTDPDNDIAGRIFDDILTAELVGTTANGGIVLLNPNGTFTYTPSENNKTGTDSFTYEISDGFGGTDTAIVMITLSNRSPVANDNSYGESHNVLLIVNEADGTIKGTLNGALIDYDPDTENPYGLFDDELTAELVTPTTYGTVVLDADGSFIYTPAPGNPSDSDSFTYKLNDNYGGMSNTATVTVNLTNQAPVANPDFYDGSQDTTLIAAASQGTIEGLLLPYEDFDPDNENPNKLFDEELTAFLDGDGTTTQGGNVVLNPDGSFTYVPPAGWGGIDTFTYYVNDGYNNSDPVSVTITITVSKRAPTGEEASLTSAPVSPELGDIGQIEGAYVSDLLWLGEELGLCEGDQQGEDENRCQEITQAYLAGAFLQASDLRPQQAAAQLRQLAGLLHDTDGSRIAALGRVINEFAQPDVPPSPEQFASIGQAFAIHVNDGTHYATAKQWLDALAEYTMLLISEIGWSPDDSVAFVMSKYGPTVTEASDVGVVAFIQMHLEDLIG